MNREQSPVQKRNVNSRHLNRDLPQNRKGTQTEMTEEEIRTLRDVPIGDTVTVVKLLGSGQIKRRIMDMCITKGAKILVSKVAPLGDPIEVKVRGFELSLRKDEAENIVVE